MNRYVGQSRTPARQTEPALSDAAAARPQELEDERAILRVLTLYCHTIDTGHTDEWLDCFTADGAFIVRDEAGTNLSRRAAGGAEGLLRAADDHSAP
jgi:hypothetical protein